MIITKNKNKKCSLSLIGILIGRILFNYNLNNGNLKDQIHRSN